MSSDLLIVRDSLMSSANSLLTMCGMSLTNIVKSRGPNTESCGTPLVTILQLDWILLSTTHCCLPTRKF